MGSNDRRGPKPTVQDEEIVAVFRDADDPVLTTREVADELPIGKRATLNRLGDLHDRGVLDRKESGARSQVWWLIEGDDQTVDAIDPDDPFFSAPPASEGGPGDVSANADAYLAAAIESESDSDSDPADER